MCVYYSCIHHASLCVLLLFFNFMSQLNDVCVIVCHANMSVSLLSSESDLLEHEKQRKKLFKPDQNQHHLVTSECL